jgi:cytochrome c-type biogenesis protein CcmH/NrfF
MNARKIILWGIPILLVGLVIACAVLESTFQEARQVAWTAYTTENSRLVDDNVHAIAFDEQGRAWIGTYCSLGV